MQGHYATTGVKAVSDIFCRDKGFPMKYGNDCLLGTADTRPQSPATGEMGRLVNLVGRTGEADGYAGKRHSIRFTQGMQLDAMIDMTRPAEVWSVTMHNISPDGFGFWSRRPVDVHQPICLREFSANAPSDWVLARVTHCTYGLCGYLIGAKAVK